MTLYTSYLYTLLIVSVHALSIEKVSEKQNVTKRAANGEFFPDWVPFKNKHGDELGEFQPVPKAKVKKRLALPVNFILRAVAEPEGDDYYDKGQGETDGDEYYEKKEWSDTNRPADEVSGNKTVINHTDISDIDGLVNIITNGQPSAVLNALQQRNSKKENNEDIYAPKTPQEAKEEEDHSKNQNQISSERKEIKPKQENKKLEDPKKNEEDLDYDENDSEKIKSKIDEDHQNENDAKKARILDSVDDLKERHAEEQRLISEKAKEEEIYQEEHERNRIGARKSLDKYDTGSPKKEPDYEEYDEEVSVQGKYIVFPSRRTNATQRPAVMSREGKEVGKQSVFKNPHLYIVYDDSEETTTPKPKSKQSIFSKTKFSSKYTSPTPTPETEKYERISLLPHDPEAKEGEPTLFFPKTRKSKKRRKNKTTTAEPDSSVAETATEQSAKDLTTTFGFTSPSAPDVTGTGADTTATGLDSTSQSSAETKDPVTGSGSSEITATGSGSAETSALAGTGSAATAPAGSGPSGLATTALASSTSHRVASAGVTDAVPASTHHKEEKKHDDYYKEKGGGREFHAKHSEEHDEHGKKAYEGVHKNAKTAKGHHDKEDHLGKYEDKGGHDKSHHEESGHYGDHHHEEHGKKHAKYEESGKHSKGHSTKGSHDIHKKEEYEKNVEFFEEEGDSAEEEKHGGYHNEKEHKAGGLFKKGDLKAEHLHRNKGEAGHFQKGGHSHVDKGHRQAGGHDGHGKNVYGKTHKEAKASGKKWVYHHGFPARNANLVVIDRRADQYYHGPQYYG